MGNLTFCQYKENNVSTTTICIMGDRFRLDKTNDCVKRNQSLVLNVAVVKTIVVLLYYTIRFDYY